MSISVGIRMLGSVDVNVAAFVLPASAFPSRIARASGAVRDAVSLDEVHEMTSILISLRDRLNYFAGFLSAAAPTKTRRLLPAWRGLFIDTFNSHCSGLLSQVDYSMAT